MAISTMQHAISILFLFELLLLLLQLLVLMIFFAIFIVNDNHWRTLFTVHEMPCTWNQVDQKSYKSISISISILFAFHFSFVYLFYGCWCYCCCFLVLLLLLVFILILLHFTSVYVREFILTSIGKSTKSSFEWTLILITLIIEWRLCS